MDESLAAPVNARDLSVAIVCDELVLAYQPKLALGAGAIIGVEALVRWNHPSLGMVLPYRFISLAEQTGLIKPLTQWVIRAAARQWAAWAAEGWMTSIAINVSARDLDQLDFPDDFLAICQEQGVPGDSITVELTESAKQNLVNLLDITTRLRLRGVHLSLDDFGTGYSSLSQLHQLPFSEVKIDKSFVMRADRSNECRAICTAIIGLAHDLGLKTVAEGVETKEVLDILTGLGCDTAQGYFISRPSTPGKVFDFVRRHRAPNFIALAKTA